MKFWSALIVVLALGISGLASAVHVDVEQHLTRTDHVQSAANESHTKPDVKKSVCDMACHVSTLAVNLLPQPGTGAAVTGYSPILAANQAWVPSFAPAPDRPPQKS